MCQILFCHKKNPPKDVLKYANENNKHGFGFAWADGDQVKWRKGFEEKDLTDELIEEFMAMTFPKAIHFRWATHGGITPELTHPFPIKRGNSLALEGDAKHVLFHNGVWSDWDDRIREAIFAGALNPNILRQHMSDSRAMAILCQRFGPDILDVLGVHGQKVLVLMHDTWYKYGSWSEKDGWAASNSKVERPTVTTMGPNDTRRWSKHGTDDKGRLPLHYQPRSATDDKPVTGTYLSSDREEVEKNLLLWGNRGHE
jgi:hypothetical protein